MLKFKSNGRLTVGCTIIRDFTVTHHVQITKQFTRDHYVLLTSCLMKLAPILCRFFAISVKSSSR